MGGFQSSISQEPQRSQNSQLQTDSFTQRDGEKHNSYSYITPSDNSRKNQSNDIQFFQQGNSNSNSNKKYEYQGKNSFESPEGHIENELQPEKQTKKNDETYSFLNNQKRDDENDIIEGTKNIGQAPIIQIQNIESIQNPNISIKENYYPWLKQRLEEIEIYEPREKFVDDQSQFVFNITLSDQSQYEGFMKNGKRHGYGINLKQTELFEGSFQDGIRKGWGRRITKDTLEYGYWENNKIQNTMEMQTKDVYYKGECKDSIPNGRGYLKRSISIYTGNFVNGRMEGQGIFEDPIKNVKYEGEFSCDKFHGQGTYYFSSGKKYVGQFKNSQFNGQGEMFWPNKCYYKGQFVNGLFEGWGYFIDQDQSIFDGYWKDGKKNGKGKLTVKNLDIIGTWENDVFQESQ